MTQDKKSILLKDLCARLPYGVKILHETWNFEWDQEMTLLERVVGIDEKFVYVKVIDTHNGEEYRDDRICVDTFNDKMYLRPMSSMTEEEEIEYDATFATIKLADGHYDSTMTYKSFDFLNAHHFDYRGLIEKGIAIEALKGIYK